MFKKKRGVFKDLSNETFWNNDLTMKDIQEAFCNWKIQALLFEKSLADILLKLQKNRIIPNIDRKIFGNIRLFFSP